ncbi:MAG: CopG family ribbon-helix-helix protein [Gammaproteobacteria bacterium]
MTTTTVGIKLDQQTRTRLRELGESKQRSPHWLMKAAIARYLDEEERCVKEKAADLARWQRYLDTGEAIPHKEAKARLNELATEAAQKIKAR